MGFESQGLIRTAPNTNSGWLYTLGILFFISCFLCFYDCINNFLINKKFPTENEGAKFRGVILFFCGWLMFQRFLMTFIPTVKNLYVIFLFHQSVPIYLQFAIFSSFVLFLTRIVYYRKGNEKMLKRFFHPFLFFLHLITLVAVFYYPYYMQEHVSIKNFHSGNFGFATVVYSIFSIFSLFFVVKVYKAVTRFRIGFKNKTKVVQTLFLISIISILYLIQAIYGFFALIKHNTVNDITDRWYLKNDHRYYIWILFWFIITEIAPIITIFVIFHLSLRRTNKAMKVEIKILENDKESELLSSTESSDEY
ncbi:hypothetical protein M0813_25663 [Anaeramoeba flamelloides]|uniref:THH1/TOM1/TOM3 domain-containing protein n=1 Tax=Anaeramoeba flamelloides TaxID=1746091 RepID=A0AAV7ZPN1_9EUKA|nr:hypothetical protein M0812_09785 [Anaeramoeba flamelloides]KAJ6239079.1 hypothetical protein M0813_25663 [Anaeramoeba flamelloides]